MVLRNIHLSVVPEVVLRVISLFLALVIALYGRYGTGFTIIDQAWPMVSYMSVSYLACSAFLTWRHFSLFGDHVTTALLSLTLMFFFSVIPLLVLRQYYSLGYITIFVLTAVTCTLVIEQFKFGRFTSRNLILIALGDWKCLANDRLFKRTIDLPDEIRGLSGDAKVVVDFDSVKDPEWQDALVQLQLKGAVFIDTSEIRELITGKVHSQNYTVDLRKLAINTSRYRYFKRVIDIVISCAAIVLLFIPSLFTTGLLAITTKGKPFYKQTRVGLRGKAFTILKFRTMNVASRGVEVSFTEKNDIRVTVIGQILRRWRIDEWPQFWNVLAGQMSVVGPRPERPEWEQRYSKDITYFSLRHLVRPGITGWAQIHQGYSSTSDGAREKTSYDLYYLKHFSLSLDLAILLQTIAVLVTGKGHR